MPCRRHTTCHYTPPPYSTRAGPDLSTDARQQVIKPPAPAALQLCASRLALSPRHAGPDKGFGVLEWAGSLVPQGVLVKGKPWRM